MHVWMTAGDAGLGYASWVLSWVKGSRKNPIPFN